jgi:hypothetical protein
MLHILIGFVTDGEFNSLRTKGEKRPLHVVQLIRNARESVTRKSKGFLLKFIVRTGGIMTCTNLCVNATYNHELSEYRYLHVHNLCPMNNNSMFLEINVKSQQHL